MDANWASEYSEMTNRPNRLHISFFHLGACKTLELEVQKLFVINMWNGIQK